MKKRDLTYESFIRKMKEANPDIEILAPFTKIGGTVKARCKKDGYVWTPYVRNLLRGSGCPMCKHRLKITKEEFLQQVAERLPDIQVLGKFSSMTDRIEVRCKVCGKTWTPITQSLYKGHGCLRCAGKEQKTTEQVKAELAVLRPDVQLLGEYESALKPVLYRFLDCGHECLISTSHVKSGRGCPICGDANRGASQRHSIQKLQSLLDQRLGDVEVVGEYVNNNTPLLFRCRRCGHEWLSRPLDIKSSRGCPQCNKSGTSFLQEFIYAFMSHAFPKDTVLERDKTAIGKELDVYIPSAKTAIEPGSWFWHQRSLEKDREKVLLCAEAGIDLITLFDHFEGDTPPFPGAMITKKELGDPENFGELVDICYAMLGRMGLSLRFSDEEIETIRSEAYRLSRGATPELYRDDVGRVNAKIEVVGEYRGENQTIQVRCKDCGYEWRPVARRLRRLAECPRCSGHIHWDHQMFVEAMAKRHPHMVVLGTYVNQQTKIQVLCKKRDVELNTFPGYLLSLQSCRACISYQKDSGSPQPHE